MVDDTVNKTEGEKSTGTKARPYKAPRLQHFGALSRLTQGSAGTSGDGQLGMSQVTMNMMPSDRRLKCNIVPVGRLPNGLGLYLFDYRKGPADFEPGERQLGVMADEVENILPGAVSVSPDGYKLVDYSQLDIRPAEVLAAFGS